MKSSPDVVFTDRLSRWAWVCGRANPPGKMTLKGLDKTDLPDRFLPMNCRKG